MAGIAAKGRGALVSDREVTIQSESDIKARRKVLVDYIWGKAGFPDKRVPEVIVPGIQSPVDGLDGLKRVDEFRMELEPGHQGLAYHFIPEKPNGELVVVHHGHACSLNDDPSEKDMGYGLQRTIKALVKGGYGVFGVFMPQMRPGDCTGGHEAIMRQATEGSPLRFFSSPPRSG